jgi:hypothetical protein
MKSAIEKALDNVKNLNVQNLEAPKPEKAKKGEVVAAYDGRPTLYLSDKELSTIRNYKIDDDVVVVCQGKVKEISSYDSPHISLKIESIADVTKG